MNEPFRKPSNPPSVFEDPDVIILGDKNGVGLLNKCKLTAYQPLPLPGVVIFVHGVNSDGEWYNAAEEGLCAGLNKRLKREDHQMAHPCAEGGQLTPAKYTDELTDDGYLNPKFSQKTFISDENNFSNVIRFRWGYKASKDDLQNVGSSVYLNEENYWGGGPFANGCTSLPDLWSEGVSDQLFLWWEIQHFNPVKSRPVFTCPPRQYFVVAALRLAKLIESIRTLQADVPITIVCHSQGNMVAIAAAFLGNRLPAISNNGKTRSCVADTYVLCNPPYSLQEAKFIENWSEGHMKDRDGGTGRQTRDARIRTLAAFFKIIRDSAKDIQTEEQINLAMANKKHNFDATDDRAKYGYGPAGTCGRVTLYCNPHDQVIGSATIRGIGWLGMSKEEISETKSADIFSQRVFAQAFPIGDEKKTYHYWTDHYAAQNDNKGVKKDKYWYPPSPSVRHRMTLSRERGVVGNIVTISAAPVLILVTTLANSKVNAFPDKKWEIPLTAPKLPSIFKPRALGFDGPSEEFDERYDIEGQQRDSQRVRTKTDPYAGDLDIPQRKNQPPREKTDAAKGNRKTEAQLRYEHHGRLRMDARREGIVEKSAPKVTAEDNPEESSNEYNDWRTKKIRGYLEDSLDNNASDHSSTLTNPEHAEKALAYDVAIGVSNISSTDLRELRVIADWRLLQGTAPNHSLFYEYFDLGLMGGIPVGKWVENHKEAKLPTEIVDQRKNPPPREWHERGD